MRKRRKDSQMTYATLEFKTLRRETAKAMLFDSVWIPKSISTVEHDPEHGYAVTVPVWFIETRNLHEKVIGQKSVDPDNRAAYKDWNEDADRIRYAENPEIFGR